MIKKPQQTGCKSIELLNEGVANGILSMLIASYPVEYDEEKDVYKVGERDD